MTRERLPNRHMNRTYRFTHNGQRYYGNVGFYFQPGGLWPDYNRPGEIFLDAGHVGSQIQYMAAAGAVGISLALQYGCPVEVIRQALPMLEDGSSADPFGELLRIIEHDVEAAK